MRTTGSVVGVAAVALAVLCSPRTARAEASATFSRFESFAMIGFTHAIDPSHELQFDQWPTVAMGGGWRLSPKLSLGVSAAWSPVYVGGVTYFPPAEDFQAANLVTSLVPVCGYVALRSPLPHRKSVFLMARAGGYILIERADRPDAPESTGARPGFGATLGISADEARFAPRMEAAYDIRSNGPGEFLPQGWLHMLTFSIGMRFQL
jgi:hypothetical protein